MAARTGRRSVRRWAAMAEAMAAGFDAAKGAVIVPMDGDLQNDPADIPKLVAKLDENGEDPGRWDIVSGWR
ncbi:MAG: glycosyltransferase, partial [Planctomycetota bacterium]